MKRISSIIVTLSLLGVAEAQNRSSIDISFLNRYDQHANYITRYGDRSYTDNMTLAGTSAALQIHFRYPVTQALRLGAGLGYGRLGISNVKSTSPWISDYIDGRAIEYNHPRGIEPLFHTERYYYNNLSLSASIGFEKKLEKHAVLNSGIAFSYLYTTSQVYHIDYGGIKFRNKEDRNLGFRLDGYVGALMKFGKDRYFVNPGIVLAIYQRLHGDKLFREKENMRISKWSKGGGVSIALGKYL